MNALRILRTLDRHLTKRCSLTIYGRAAFALGFSDSTQAQRKSLDVDVLMPLSQAEEFLTEFYFWDAQQATNDELGGEGLYITHLFREDQAVLLPDWLTTRIRLNYDLANIELFRPD